MKPEFLVQREGKAFVLYAGLLDEAHQQGLKSIRTNIVQIPNDDNGAVAIVTAVVETEKGTFTGIGDASPANVTRIMVQHIIRMAETRAKARALRDAINVGVAALEELGDDDDAPAPRAKARPSSPPQRTAPTRLYDRDNPLGEEHTAAAPPPAQRQTRPPVTPAAQRPPTGIDGMPTTPEILLAAIKKQRERLGWSPDALVGWIKDKHNGRGPLQLTADEAKEVINLMAQEPKAGG